MEQSGDEATALKKMKDTYNPTLLYTSMIEIVLSKRSKNEVKSIETLYSWCTYAKDRLSVYEIQQIWDLDPLLGEFDVLSEIQGKSQRYVTNPFFLERLGVASPLDDLYEAASLAS